jgi:ribonuclease BN (tRNA processing enzyme)
MRLSTSIEIAMGRDPIRATCEHAAVQLTVVGCSPAWPNPGGAQSGYLLEGAGALLLECGPGVLARLRQRDAWPVVDSIVITHFHLDHWGDLVPWVWGSMYLQAGGGSLTSPELWVPAGGRQVLAEIGERLGFADMFERTFGLAEYQPGVPFTTAGHTVTALRVPHYRLEAHGLRVTDGKRTLAYSGDSGPTDVLVELARDADLFVAEATLASPEADGDLRGHLSLDEALGAFHASGARQLLVTHRPVELPLPGGWDQAYDGLVRAV